MYKYCDDGILAKRVLDGETNLFGELISRYQELVYGLAYGKVGNFTDAQDIAQDVFIKAYRKLGQLETPENFAAWLKIITANECKNWLRQKKNAIPLDDIELLPSYASLTKIDQKNQEFRAEVLQSVDALSATYRTVITLHYLSGLSYEEIGESLGISVATVVNRMHRARRQLKADMMNRVERAMTDARLPDTFAQDVLTRMTLCPLDAGSIVCTKSDDEAIIVLGVSGKKSELLLLAINRIDMYAIENCNTTDLDAYPRIRELTSMINSMKASRTHPKEIILYLDRKTSCYARMLVIQNREESYRKLKVSDALLIALKTGIPISAESNLINKGIVGADGGVYKILQNIQDFRSYLPLVSQRMRLDRNAYYAAPTTIRGSHIIRCSVDLASRILKLHVMTTDITVELSLNDYMIGLEHFFSPTNKNHKYSYIEDDDGDIFKVTYEIIDGETMIIFIPEVQAGDCTENYTDNLYPAN